MIVLPGDCIRRRLLTVGSRQNYPLSLANVLVQREMERGLSPLVLVSIARASAGRVARTNAAVGGTTKQRMETATGLKGRSDWITIGAPAAPDSGIIELRPGGTLGMTAETHTRSEIPTGEEKKNLESRVRGVFNRMTYRASAPVQMSVGRVACVGRPVQLPSGA